MSSPRYVAVANLEGLRWRAYHGDLLAFWRERDVVPIVEVVPWRDVVEREGCLDDFPAFDQPGILRIESPGRDWEVTRRLLAVGSRATGEVHDWSQLEERKGWLVRPGLIYAGFRRVLEGMQHSLDRCDHLHLTAQPHEIAETFDKNATCDRLRRAGIPVPQSFESPSSSSDLLDAIRQRGWRTTYVKLNSGSSASAIAVVEDSGSQVSAISTIIPMQGEFWSMRRLRRHRGDELEAVLRFLLREGVCVQQGIRMAQIDGLNFDVRIVMIHRRPAFRIFRLSHLPMTNLHLGGRRGDERRCRACIPQRAWLDAMDDCIRIAETYRATTLGIDVVFELGSFRHYVLEVNAFGDFFPRLLDDARRSVHRVEIEETAQRFNLVELPHHRFG